MLQRYPLRKLQQQVTFLGLMTGVFISGLISDRFGRRRTMLVLLLVTVTVSWDWWGEPSRDQDSDH